MCPDERLREQSRTATGDLRVVTPLTDVFYRAATPIARHCVSEGDLVVEPQTVIGLIETMTIYNEATADRSGQAMAFHVQAGKQVPTGTASVSLWSARREALERP